jgi:hypothetical protein
VERRPADRQASEDEPMALSRSELARELTELIAALDRRLPRVEQAGEAAIAREAAALRARAVERLAEITSESRGAAAKKGDR